MRPTRDLSRDILKYSAHVQWYASYPVATPPNCPWRLGLRFFGFCGMVLYSTQRQPQPLTDAHRGMEFLYSLDHLHVAISRAKCVAVLVASIVITQTGG